MTIADGAVYFVATSLLMLKIAKIWQSKPVFFRITRQLSKTTKFSFKPKKKLLKRDSMVLQMLDEHENDDIDFGAMYVISDPSLPDCPVVYASKGFCAFTQYKKAQVEGRNCRFLQGTDTDPADVSRISQAIHNKSEVSVCLLNYKKDGTSFYNQFFLLPLHDEAGQLLYYLGVSKDIPSKGDHQESLNKGWRIFSWQPRYVRWVI